MPPGNWRNEIESFDLRKSSDNRLRDIHAFERLMEVEATPEDPGRSFDDYIAAVRSIPRFIDVQALVARDSRGEIAGEAECVLVRTEDNPHLAQVSIGVRPGMRGRGVARRLLSEAVDFAGADGRSVFIGVTMDRVPSGEAFARRIGAVAVNTSHESRLRLADVDRELVDKWIREGSPRAIGYSLLVEDSPLPESIVTEVASLLDVMNDAPSGTSAGNDRHSTAAQLREWEDQAARTGRVKRWMFAKHEASASLVGLTEVEWSLSHPFTIQQGDTGVASQHRGYGLGKWLKASMIRSILEDCPQAVYVRTNNADSNAAMQGINRKLGFEHYMGQTTWQAHLSGLQAYLET